MGEEKERFLVEKIGLLKYGVSLEVSMLNDPLTTKHQGDQAQFWKKEIRKAY